MRSALALLLLLMIPRELLAQEPSPAEVAVAREQFNRGVAAAKEDRWEDAYDAFSRAYALTKKTSILFNLAGAEVKTGRWVEGRETYRKFLREAGDDQAKAKSEARRLLATLEGEIPRITIRVEGEDADDTITLDGRELPRAVLGVELPVNPGRHVLVRAHGGTEIAREELEIGKAERREILLPAPREPSDAIAAVPPPPAAPPPPPPPVVVAPVEPPREEGESFFATPWFWIIAGAVLIAGGVAAGVVLASGDDPPYAGTTGIVLRGLEP